MMSVMCTWQNEKMVTGSSTREKILRYREIIFLFVTESINRWRRRLKAEHPKGQKTQMSRIIHTSFILFALSSMIWAGDTHFPKRSSRGIFFDARKRQTEYAGPGREKGLPTGVKEVLIGYFGPSMPSDPRGFVMWTAA